jgi:hypothetical protein
MTNVWRVFDRLISFAWILAFLMVASVFAYEMFAPCGLRSMSQDTSAWVERGCGRS